MSKSRVTALSTIQIREYAMRIRKLLGYKDNEFINSPKLFDRLSIFFDKFGLYFDYRVLNDDDKIFEPNEEAFTDLASGTIYIKESVMKESCCKRYRRGTFTLMHELGHYFLHYLQNEVKLSRVADNIYVPRYQDPEWQADVFASEFLMPFKECVSMNPEEIRNIYHVSRKASQVRYDKIKKEISKI